MNWLAAIVMSLSLLASACAPANQARGPAAPSIASSPQPTPAQRLIGDFAPKLVELTDNVLFGDVWARPDLSPRDRSLVTVSALIAMNRPEQLRSHLVRARDKDRKSTRLNSSH